MKIFTKEILVKDSGMYPQALQYEDFSIRPPSDHEDLRAYGRALQDALMIALRNRLSVRGKTCPEFWVLTKDNLYLLHLTYETPEEKSRVLRTLRAFPREVGAWGTVWVADRVATSDKGSVEHLRSEPPSQHPERVDALMVLLAFSSGEHRILLQPYREEDGAFIWGEMQDVSRSFSPAAEQSPTG